MLSQMETKHIKDPESWLPDTRNIKNLNARQKFSKGIINKWMGHIEVFESLQNSVSV